MVEKFHFSVIFSKELRFAPCEHMSIRLFFSFVSLYVVLIFTCCIFSGRCIILWL